jgi:subtilisin family serine protease
MAISKEQFEGIVLKEYSHSPRFTQDSPIYPDVWLEYFENKDRITDYRADLILIPHNKSSAAELYMHLHKNLHGNNNKTVGKGHRMASNGETVAAFLTLDELLKVALPLTNWYQKYLWKEGKKTEDLDWLKQVIGAIYATNSFRLSADKNKTEFTQRLESISDRYYTFHQPAKLRKPLTLWSISKNREATIALEKSVPATKADATRRVFNIDASNITWAILDSGIDASHVAFLKTDPVTQKKFENPLGAKNDPESNHTRIVATYDFSRFRELLVEINDSKSASRKKLLNFLLKNTGNMQDETLDELQIESFITEIEKDLKLGRMLDWTIVAPLLRIPHNEKEYRPPVHPHGTHVAGILGADMAGQPQNANIIGMCPGINIYDIRVLNDAGMGTEFNILAGIQFIKWLNNRKKDGLVIHGVNLSLSIPHAVKSFACGQTPICEACNQLVNEGVVVVAAAGNLGQSIYKDTDGNTSQGFRIVNITDPGNTESVITVGATHAEKPHTYGVSYFSSKGPTGDGRSKPDLVAPGEKVKSTIPGNRIDRMDGTSQAAPHVSGAAALLLAKNTELIGKPLRVKDILCKTATDLGRLKYFQGFGMVDTLRALQCI